MKHEYGSIIHDFEEWRLTEIGFEPINNRRNESLFSLGNGYIGMRGNFEEGYSAPVGYTLDGTYLNGFYDSAPLQYADFGYGWPDKRQTMLNVTNSKLIYPVIDGQRLAVSSSDLHLFRRVLDMRKGTLLRELVWYLRDGRRVQVRIERMVCLARRQAAAIRYILDPLDGGGELLLVSGLNGEVYNQITAGDPRSGSALVGQVLLLDGKVQEQEFGALLQRTKTTQFKLACAADHVLETESPFRVELHAPDQAVQVHYIVQLERGRTVQLDKFIAYATALDFPDEEIMPVVRREVAEAKRIGFGGLAWEQRQALDEFWRRADVEVHGDPAVQQGLRFNAFQLLQNTGKDGRTGMGAKGLSGEGYEGHYFWDSDVFVAPSFLFIQPRVTRALLEHRHSLIEKARHRAAELHHKGALYAWRTINGEELSSYFPAGTAQYHVNAGIAYAIKHYVQTTEDFEFLYDHGAEMLIETARFWLSLGCYIRRKGFCINTVTGPDEYTALVNNNAYTNIMARANFEFAAHTVALMEERAPGKLRALAEKLRLEPDEPRAWLDAAQAMYLAHDAELGIIAQDDAFLEKGRWPGAGEETQPLFLRYHYLNLYRAQVLKQADLLLAMFLERERFTHAQKKRCYDYYEPITSHDSSLSPCVHAIIAGELGYKDQAYQYFLQTVRMDLDDYHGNAGDGLHCAAMAGCRLALVHSFGGLHESGGQLCFRPFLPHTWRELAFRVSYRGRLIEVALDERQACYRLLEGEPIEIRHRATPLRLERGVTSECGLPPAMRGVIFDLDGVITDTAHEHYRAWKRLADDLGLRFDVQFNERLKGVPRRQSLELILQYNGVELSDAKIVELLARKNEYYVEGLQNMGPEALLPGIERLLRELKDNGIKLMLASSSLNAPAIVERLGVKHYFDQIVDAAAIEKGKPDPEIFLAGADLCGLEYQDCAGIEDAAAGVAAIKGAGMFAVGVGERAALQQADWIVASTRELTFEGLSRQFTAHTARRPAIDALAPLAIAAGNG